jgi:DNA-binding MarR family transcriptional regulator
MSNPADVPYSTTILVRDTCLCLHAQRAARALARRFDDELKPHGLTNGQFSLLMSLNRPEPPPMGPVAEVLAMDQTTLTAALKPLERRGLVERRANPNDRRSRLLALTEEGRRTLAAAVPVWKRVHADIEEGLSDPERLRADLRVLSFGAPPPAGDGSDANPPTAGDRAD